MWLCYLSLQVVVYSTFFTPFIKKKVIPNSKIFLMWKLVLFIKSCYFPRAEKIIEVYSTFFTPLALLFLETNYQLINRKIQRNLDIKHTQIHGCFRASAAVMRLAGLTVNIELMRFLASGVTVSHSGEGYWKKSWININIKSPTVVYNCS